jgi:hypothetical protein
MTKNNGTATGTTETNGEEKKRAIKIAVGSSNPCKVNAVRDAMQRVIGLSPSLGFELQVQGFSVASVVPDQPFGDVSSKVSSYSVHIHNIFYYFIQKATRTVSSLLSNYLVGRSRRKLVNYVFSYYLFARCAVMYVYAARDPSRSQTSSASCV